MAGDGSAHTNIMVGAQYSCKDTQKYIDIVTAYQLPIVWKLFEYAIVCFFHRTMSCVAASFPLMLR